MKRINARKITLIALLSGVMGLAACSTGQVIDNTVNVAAGTTKVAAKTAVGAGKLVYRGGRAVISSDE